MATTDEIALSQNLTAAWKRCAVCRNTVVFKTPRDFCRHLRESHCTREGGSFVCRYGQNGVCPTLPLDGVSDKDYEDHVAREHVPGDQGSHASRAASRLAAATNGAASACAEPSVVHDQHKWTIYMSQVSLPAALNDPRLARRETDFFTKTWGEAFDKTEVAPIVHLPTITRAHFYKYLKKIRGRVKQHKKSVAVATAEDGNKNMLPVEDFPVLHMKHPHIDRSELETIPKLFLLPNFTLENLDTFNAIIPHHDAVSVNAQSRQFSHSSQSSKLLQEKLSHYLDVVEVQIARQISQKSEAFFHAMTSHDELQDYMKNTLTAIKSLREKINQLDTLVAQGPLKILRYQLAKSNYVTLYNKLKLMSTVHQTQPTIQLLLSTNEFVGALDLICTTQEVLTQELAGVHSFRHLGSQLAELEKLIDKMLQEDFVKYATADLNRPLSEGDAVMEEERLAAIVLGMLRQHKFHFVDVYREEAFTGLKATIKQTVIEAVAAAEDIDNDNNAASLADQMRLLNYDQWTTLINNVFRNLMVIIRRVQAVCAVIYEVLQIAAGLNRLDESLVLYDKATGECKSVPTTPISSASSLRLSVSQDIDVMISQSEYATVDEALKDMMCQICDQAHDRCVKVLVARAKDGFLEKLSSSEFLSLSRAIEQFVSQCEQVCGRKSTSLRASLQTQASKFVFRFHEERKTKLSLILDNERWKQADVPPEFQLLVTHICDTDTLSIPEKKPSESELEKRLQEFLLVNGDKYNVVGTVLMLLKMVVEYCQCVIDIPSVTSDILTRLIELLKMYNSRTCQLILGAGALQLVGLKTITTKNLALASRCLQLVVYYLPKVRKHFEDRLQGKQANMIKNFEHVLKDYNDHIAEINNKLLAIMDSMLETHLKKWEVKAPMPSACFRSICKQITKLHEAICDLLPNHQLEELFQNIHKSFKSNLQVQLVRLAVNKDGGPQHGLVMSDVAFYTRSLSCLPGLSDITNDMEDIWDR